MAGGDLTLTACTFSNNTSGQSFGGAVFVLAQSVVSSLNATNSTFLNNSMTNNSGAGPDGGGAILIMTPGGSVHNLVGCTFGGNRVIGNSGNTYGGAIQINGGILNIVNSTFVTNSATGQGGLGGALYVDSGTVNLSFCRLAGNSATHGAGAVYNHGSNGASTTATNNWWGCNGGPGAGGCDVVTSDGGTLVFNPWIIITNSASPGTIGLGQSTALTASVLRNSSNQAFTAAQVPVLIGLPLTWNGVLFGSLSAAQTTIQANGQATATFTNDGTCNNGSADAILDSGTATAMPGSDGHQSEQCERHHASGEQLDLDHPCG
jgi:predicted outer membrane repeat protein